MEEFRISESKPEGKKESSPLKVQKLMKKALIGLGIVGSSFAPLSNDKSDTNLDQINPYNKLEWSRNDIESNEQYNIAHYFSEKSRQERIDFFEKEYSELEMELLENEENLLNTTDKNTRIKIQNVIGYINQEFDYIKETLRLWYSENKDVQDSLLNEVTKEKIQEINTFINLYDEGRLFILKNIENPKYIERFSKEYLTKDSWINILDEKRQKSILKIMLESRKEQAEDSDFILSKNIEKSYDKASSSTQSGKNVGAFYDGSKNKVVFPLEDEVFSSKVQLAIHEYAHKVTHGNLSLSNHAKQLFSEAFDSVSVVGHLDEFGGVTQDTLGQITYFSDPTEMYARKKVFEFELERLNIKKYEEEFTNLHYIKALKSLKDNYLEQNAKEFLYLIKPTKIKKVMNEIASSDTKSEDVTNV